MSNVFTLDSFKDEVEKEYAPLVLEMGDKKLTLRNMLRIPRKKRERVFELIDLLDEFNKAKKDDEGNDVEGDESIEDIGEAAIEIITLVADDDKLVQSLVGSLEEDLALALKLFEAWMEATQAGEAKRSDTSSTSTESTSPQT